MRIFGAVIEIGPGFLAHFISINLHRGPVRRSPVCDHHLGIPISLDFFLEEFQRGRFVPLLRDKRFPNFAFVAGSAPQVVPLAASVGYACLRLTNTSSRCQCHWGLSRIDSDRRFRILCEKYVPKRPTQRRTLSWQMSIPRSCRRSSTLRSESGNRTYISTPSWMISGEVLK